jgi:ABC-type Fe3+-hydroxamate transport system substrate-binding protein
MRIVSLVPSITEALCMLGLEDSLVGVTDYCVHPAHVVERTPHVGGTKNPSLQQITELHPDLVIVNTDENRRQTFDSLKAAGLNILVTQTDSLDEVEEAWRRIGEATGKEELAGTYRENIASARAYNRAALRDMDCIPALIPVWRDPWMASGSGTYMESLLSECGFHNVLSHAGKKWVKIALPSGREHDACALQERPEAVLLPSEPYHFTDQDRSAFAAIGVPPAKVHLVDGVLLSWWLSRTVVALEHFRRLRFALKPVVGSAQ